MWLTDIRNNSGSRSPREVGLCAIRWLPDNALPFLEKNYGSFPKSLAVDEWLEDRQEKYAYVGDWLAHWQLDMSQPRGEKASLYSATANSVHSFINLCYGVVRLSTNYPHFSEDDGGIRLACNALFSDFFRDMADSGIGRTLAFPGYPEPLIEGKTDGYQRAVRELRSLGFKPGNRAKAKPGRPKGTVIRSYPNECRGFSQVIDDAKRIAVKNTEFRHNLYTPWLTAKSQENTSCQLTGVFRTGVVSGNQLLLGEKGWPKTRKNN